MNWPTVKLKDEARLITKGTTPTTLGLKFLKEGIPFLRAQNLVDGSVSVAADPIFISPETHDALRRSKIQPSDVLISIAGTIGRAAIVPNDAVEMNCNQAVAIVRPSDRIDRRFFLHWLSGSDALAQVTQSTVTGVISNLSLGQIGNLEVPLPSLTEQRRIAAILDKADAIRRKREQALTLADDFLRSVFLEMFGDPAENERGWPVSPLGDLGDVQGGLQVTAKRVAMGLTLPYLRVANVYRDRLNLDEIKQINLSESEFKRVRLEGGDILIVEGHGNPDEIGRAAIWDGSIDPCVHQNHLIRFRANRKRALPDFISRFLNSDGGRQQLIGAGRTTSGLNTISTRKVKEVSVPLPPVALQEQFAHVVRKQVALTSRLLGQKVMANDLFAALSQRAFAGDL